MERRDAGLSFWIVGSGAHENANAPHPLGRLLRARRERPCGRYAAKYKNKFSPPNGDCHVTLSRIWLPLYLIFS
jgi:hypothetical protein